MDRRDVLRLGGVAAILVSGIAPTFHVRPAVAALPRGGRVVVVGGGFGGSAIATHLRRFAPETEVVLIDPNPDFFSGPSSIDYVFGRVGRAAASRSYAGLDAKGVRRVQARVSAIDPVRKVVETPSGAFAYTALVLAGGIELAPNEIEGLDGAGNLTPYDRFALDELRARIAGFSGGTVVVSVPPGALKCPPAPYEYALMMAHAIRARKLDGKVVLIDYWPNPQPDSIAPGLTSAMEELGDLIEYVGQETIERVDAATRTIHTGMGDEFAYDLLSLIPPNRPSRLAAEAGIAGDGDPFAQVDPVTGRSLAHADVFAIGDMARLPYGNNAASAAGIALEAATAIARTLGARGLPAAGTAEVETACYPYVTPDKALRLSVAFTARTGSLSSVPTVENVGDGANVRRRREWEKGLLDGIFA